MNSTTNIIIKWQSSSEKNEFGQRELDNKSSKFGTMFNENSFQYKGKREKYKTTNKVNFKDVLK